DYMGGGAIILSRQARGQQVRGPIGAVRRLGGLIWWLVLALLATACQRKVTPGTLHIEAPSAGSYEIYSIAGDASLQFVADQVGHYNEDLVLRPGSYLILADCSHQTVVIQPGETSRLVAHRVHFIPPHPPDEGD